MHNKVAWSLYLVTNRQDISTKKFKHIIAESIAGGVNIVQLREKNISDTEYIKIANEIKPILDEHHIPLIINDNPYVAKEVNAAGVHIGQKDCDVIEARKILGEKAIIGISIEKLEQAHNVNDLPVNYAAISPIFDTKTKKDIATPLGIENAKLVRQIVNKPLLAIGGINENNIDQLDIGLDGVCIVSAIFNSDNPRLAATNLKNALRLHHMRHPGLDPGSSKAEKESLSTLNNDVVGKS